MNGKKMMLLGIAIILLGIACNSMTTLIAEGLNTFVGNYAHWAGILVTIGGLFVSGDANKDAE